MIPMTVTFNIAPEELTDVCEGRSYDTSRLTAEEVRNIVKMVALYGALAAVEEAAAKGRLNRQVQSLIDRGDITVGRGTPS